jgi:quercetin dioxygenase-like cupin family protein
MSFRLVEIPVAQPDDPQRAPHLHEDFEECIFVLEGSGVTCTELEDHEVQAGDTIIVPAGELHVTRNTGDAPLKLLCFFPVPDIVPGTRTLEFSHLKHGQRDTR